MMKNLALVLCLVSFSGCQKLKPESVNISEYPDFGSLMIEQVEILGNTQIIKKVCLDGQCEIQLLDMDSSKWAKELSFLKEINPNRPEYVGAFEKSGDETYQILNLAVGENGALKKVMVSKDDGGFNTITTTFHEDKDVYIHHRDIELNFEKGLLSSYEINGYQKMMFKDTVKFKVKVEVN